MKFDGAFPCSHVIGARQMLVSRHEMELDIDHVPGLSSVVGLSR